MTYAEKVQFPKGLTRMNNSFQFFFVQILNRFIWFVD